MGGILIVEDDTSSRHMLRLLLERKGHTIWEASSPEIGWRIMETEAAPDLLISDLWLGDGTGIDLLRRMRDDPIWNGLPVVLISAQPNREAVTDSLPLKPTAFLTKPYDPGRINQAVAKALAERWQRQHFEDPAAVFRRMGTDRDRILEMARKAFAALAAVGRTEGAEGALSADLVELVSDLGMITLEKELRSLSKHGAAAAPSLLARLPVLERLYVAIMVHVRDV